MRELSGIVETLRLVNQARRRFLELSSIERDCIAPMLDRMAEDLQQITTCSTEAKPPGQCGGTR